MVNFLKYVLSVASLFVIIFTSLIFGVLLFGEDIFDKSYQSVLQKKYDVLINTDDPKIIIIGGSNTSFGIVEERIEEETGYKVVNLGVHAGFGGVVPTELSKANINKGDVVLLAYEWGWHTPGYFTMFGTDLVMSAIDEKIEMYRWIPIEHYSKMIGYLWEYAEKKMSYTGAAGTYSSESFDEKGRMILSRPESVMVYEGNEATLGTVNLKNSAIAEDVVKYLIAYRDYVNECGAEVYFVSPPIYKGAVKSDENDFEKLIKLEEKLIDIKYISNPNDYLFPNEYIFDTPYHCTDAGEKYRTELLINDLSSVLAK